MYLSGERSFFVYIVSNRSKTLYTGVTNNLLRRVWEHKQGVGSEFCKHYKLDRLVYFERFQYVKNAIAREQQIKGWLRSKKIALVVSRNSTWSDLSAEWCPATPAAACIGQTVSCNPGGRSFALLRMTNRWWIRQELWISALWQTGVCAPHEYISRR